MLQGVAQAFRDKPQDIETNRAGLLKALQQKARQQGGRDHGRRSADPARRCSTRSPTASPQECDPVWGGFGQAPKFPSPYMFEMHLARLAARPRQHAAVRRRHRHARPHVPGRHLRSPRRRLRALRHRQRMADPALREDALRQRAAHRSADAWSGRRPGARSTPRASPRPATGRCARWWPEGGGFAATYDADSEGVEGKFYVWDEAEIDSVLGADAAFFKQAYDVTPQGNWEHHTILHRNRAAAAPGRRRGATAGGPARQAEGGARQARVAGLGRQGSGRLERPDDRRPRQRRRRVPARRLAGRRGPRLALRHGPHARRGRTAVPFPSRRQAPASRHARRLRQHGARRHRPLRGDRRDALPRRGEGADRRARPAFRRSRRPAATSSPPTMPPT